MSDLIAAAKETRANLPVEEPGVNAIARSYQGVQQVFSNVVPYMIYGVQRIGKAGVIGLALGVFSLILFVTGNAPLHQDISMQQTKLGALRMTAARTQGGMQISSPDQKAAGFVRELPGVNDLPMLMASLVAIAAKAGIELETGTYEYVNAGTDSIARYEMSLPVVGSYPEVREFIENALATTPSITLESMRIERGKVLEQRITADLEFAILLEAKQ